MSNQQKDGSLWIASGLTSLGFLIMVFIAYMVYRWFEVYTLMDKVLPIEESKREIAAILFATVAVSVTLILMVHANLLAPLTIKAKKIYWSKGLLVAISFIINYFFWEVWSTDLPEGVKMPAEQAKSFKWFICSLNAAFDYGLAHLFDVLRKRSGRIQDSFKLNETLKKLNQKVIKAKSTLDQIEARQKQVEQDFEERTCTKCGYVAKTKHGLNGHSCKTVNK